MPPGIKASRNAATQTGRFVGPSVFFVSFLTYLFTLAPGITFWDSPELALGAFSLGLSHPPAYPLFCMFGKIFTLLPFGSAAYRTNLLSAFFGASSVWFLYFLVREIMGERVGAHWLAGAGALMFAFYPSFWGISVITEVYALNAFLLLAAMAAVLFYEKRRDDRFLLLSSFLAGLALANHQGTVFFLPPYAAYFLLSGKNYRKVTLLAAAAFFFILAYSLNLYLPVRASAVPLINIGNPVIFPWFAWLMKWGEYVKALGGLYQSFSAAKILALAGVAAALGVMAYALRRRPFFLLLASLPLLYAAGVYAVTSGAEDAQKWGLAGKFYIPSVMFAVLFGAAAMSSLTAAGKAGRGLLKAVSASLLAGALVLAATGYRHADNSRNFFAYDWGMNTLKSVKQDAALFGFGDNGVFPVWYLQKVERYRDDVAYFYPEIMTFEWEKETGRILLEKYGIKYRPDFSVAEVKKNIPVLRLSLERVAPTYFDYSTMRFLDAPFERLKPQGLVHLAPSRPGMPLGRIWETYVIRGAYDGSTDKAFAAEGVLSLYAWEAAVWAQDAYSRGSLNEALTACEYSEKLGMENPYFEKWKGEIIKMLDKKKT